MKRNAAKNRKAESIKASPVPPNDSINPNDILRANLVNMGYQTEEINAALDEMWNLSLQYDEVDSVLNYLQERKTRSASPPITNSITTNTNTTSTHSTPYQQEAPVQEAPSSEITNPTENLKEEAETVSTIASLTPTKYAKDQLQPKSTSTAVTHPTKTLKDQHSNSNSNTNTNADKEQLINAHTQQNGVQAKGKRKSRRALDSSTDTTNDLGSKLDTVANTQNLLDGITALTQWVTKAATVLELKEFCAGTTTHALTIVVRRSISPTENVNIIPQLLDLLCSILRRIGIQTRDLTSSAKALQVVIVQSRATVSSSTTLDQNIANSIARNVIGGISKTVDRVTSASQVGARSIQSLEAEIQGIVSDLPINNTSTLNARELMSNRDCQKVVAEKYSKILDITMQSKNASSSSDTTNGHGARDGLSNSSDIIASLLGDQHDTISTSKLRQQELQTRLAAATSSTFNARQRIVSNITAYVSEREQINTQLEELKLEIHRLTLSQSTLTQNIDARNQELAKFDRSLTGEAREIEAHLTETSKKVKIYDSVVGVANHLQGLSNTLSTSSDNVMKVVAEKSPIGDMANAKLSKNMEVYLIRMMNYFDTEVRMVGFLRERAISLEQQVPSLELEIQECTALGMTSNVSEMSKNLKDMVQNVADDRGIADALRAEAAKMRDDLMERSNQHLDMVRRGELKALDAVQHRYVLDMIRQRAIQIELPETSRYRALIDSVIAMSTPTAPPVPPTVSTPPLPLTVPAPPAPSTAPTPSTAPAPITTPASPENIAALATPAPIDTTIPVLAAPATIAPITPAAPSLAKVATNTNGYNANGNDNHAYAPTTSFQNSKIKIPGHVIVGGDIGGIVGAGSTVGKNIAAIEKIVAATPASAPIPVVIPAAKAGWGTVDNSKTPSRSLLDIQKEELSMK